jgi:hypothetical protein
MERHGVAGLLLILCLLAGCVRGPSANESGIVEGMVLLGPTCPVERDPPEPGCGDRPYSTELEAVPASGRGDAVRFHSEGDGSFTVPLPPGNYTIRSASNAQQPPTCSSPEFMVVADATVRVDVSCDSGIR